MWLQEYVTNNTFQSAQPSCGDVTSSDTKTVSVSASLFHRDAPIVAPYGIVYVPPINEKSVVLPLDSGAVCLGVLSGNATLEEGELMLFSKGGASIMLKNSGEVLINGKVVE